jgi:hypothetical protein
MKRTVLRAIFVCLALSLAGLLTWNILLRPPKDVADLLTPILDAGLRADDFKHGRGSPAWKVEDGLDRLVKNQSAAADTASVILLDYRLGEHNAETQLCAVTSRGARIMPLLTRYQQRPAGLLKPQYELLKLPRESREFVYHEVFSAVAKGEVVGCD